MSMEPEWRKDIGDRVAAARKARGWTYRDLMQRSGVSAGHIYKIEHCKADPSVIVILHIAEALDMGIEQLCGTKPVDKRLEEVEAECQRYFRTIQRVKAALATTGDER